MSLLTDAVAALTAEISLTETLVRSLEADKATLQNELANASGDAEAAAITAQVTRLASLQPPAPVPVA